MPQGRAQVQPLLLLQAWGCRSLLMRWGEREGSLLHPSICTSSDILLLAFIAL